MRVSDQGRDVVCTGPQWLPISERVRGTIAFTAQFLPALSEDVVFRQEQQHHVFGYLSVYIHNGSIGTGFQPVIGACRCVKSVSMATHFTRNHAPVETTLWLSSCMPLAIGPRPPNRPLFHSSCEAGDHYALENRPEQPARIPLYAKCTSHRYCQRRVVIDVGCWRCHSVDPNTGFACVGLSCI